MCSVWGMLLEQIAVITVLRSRRWANDCPKRVELIQRSIKLLLLHLVGHLYYSPTLMMHGETQIKSNIILEFSIDYPTPIFTKNNLTYKKKYLPRKSIDRKQQRKITTPIQMLYLYSASTKFLRSFKLTRLFKKNMFSDEVTLHVWDTVHRHNVRIWGTENPHIVKKHICDRPKFDICFVVDAVHATNGVLRKGMKNFESFTTSPSKVHCVYSIF